VRERTADLPVRRRPRADRSPRRRRGAAEGGEDRHDGGHLLRGGVGVDHAEHGSSRLVLGCRRRLVAHRGASHLV